MAGEDKVRVPFIGETNKATLGIAALAGVGALAFAWYKKKKTAAAAATTTQPGQYAYGYGSQPAVYGYGAEQYSPYGYGFGPYGLGAYGGQSGEYGYGYYGAGVGSVPEQVPSHASTNAEWSQATVSALTAQGFAGQDVLTALGLYLTGSPMSATQTGVIQAAIAAEGYPPVAGASGYPPAINSGGTVGGGQGGTTPAGGGGGGQTGGGGGTVQVPNVVGQNLAVAIRNIENAGLKEHTITSGIANPSNWTAIGQNPAGGQVPAGSTITVSAAPVGKKK